MEKSQAQTLLESFPSNEDFFYEGSPTDIYKPTPYGQKRVFRYTCVNRQMAERDAEKHLAGITQIVAQPLLKNKTCWWAQADYDRYDLAKNFTPPVELASILNFSRSKSGGIYATAVFTSRQYASTARRLMGRWSRMLGWWPCEINPKQEQLTGETPKGNGVALPYFGCHVVPDIIKYAVPIEEWFVDSEPSEMSGASAESRADSPDDPNDAGWWTDEALLAMLTFYKDNFPGFTFRKCRQGFAVPCPGNPKLGGWSDGAKHSTDDPLISHEALVFIRNNWPKFRCVHAHCESPKKTINHWREYWDPLRLWEFIEWQDAEMERLNRVR